MNAALPIIFVLTAGGLGGAAFWALGLPLPWMLGSLAASGLLTTGYRPWTVPRHVRDAARPVIGLLAGSAFTPAIVAAIPQWWPALLLALAATLLSIGAGYLYFTRIAKLDRVTAFFASSPGGLAELTLLGGSHGGDLRALVLVHSMRIVFVVFLLPLGLQTFFDYDLTAPPASHGPAESGTVADWFILAACGVGGYTLGRAVKMPGGVMIPTLLLSATVHAAGVTSFAPPGWIVALVQIVIGSAAGSRFAGTSWREFRGLARHGAIWSLALLSLSAMLAFAGTLVLDQPLPALLLALSPGGIAEMTIIAYAIGIEAAFVITCQVSRILLVYTLAPTLFAVSGIGREPGRP